MLAYADYDLPFILYTDASGKGPGAVLSQEQKGQEPVIAYASRGLSPSERNYPVHKLEFLALKWAVTEKFLDYLYGAKCKFTIYTDNNPLTYSTAGPQLTTAFTPPLTGFRFRDLRIFLHASTFHIVGRPTNR